MDRAAFLDRVREAVATAEPVELPSAFPATPASGTAADFETFQAAVTANNAMARLVSRDELASAVADVARELRSSRSVVVTPDTAPWREEIERGLAEAHAELLRPEGEAWRQQAEQADMGITSAELAVASTGSILIVPGPDHPRVASLLPTVHLAIVPVDRLVGGFEDIMPVLSELAGRSSAPVLVTGPSKTSDIEMTMVFGVHGPKVLRVLVVEA
jgi:L-lactate dehydrogenase complex protein LldG